MEYSNFIRLQDLVNNPSARVPVCLCLDTSDSMKSVEDDGTIVHTGRTIYKDGRQWEIVEGGGESRLQAMRAGVDAFYNALRADDDARDAAEVSLVTFDTQARCIQDFGWLDRLEAVPTFTAQGDTHMGEGVNLALDLLDQRKQEYKDKGVDYFQPWLVLMTDGVPNGNPAELERAIQRVNALVMQKKLTVFPIAIGSGADMEVLRRFSPQRDPLHLKGLKFREFFQWLGASVSLTSKSTPGERIKLDTEGIKGWSEL